jgi:hypothetical protein
MAGPIRRFRQSLAGVCRNVAVGAVHAIHTRAQTRPALVSRPYACQTEKRPNVAEPTSELWQRRTDRNFGNSVPMSGSATSSTVEPLTPATGLICGEVATCWRTTPTAPPTSPSPIRHSGYPATKNSGADWHYMLRHGATFRCAGTGSTT